MKIKEFGEYYSVDSDKRHPNSLELLESNDILSASTLNRPLLNLYEDLKDEHIAFQNIIKLLLQDKKTGYIDGVLEGFKANNVALFEAKNEKNEDSYFIRIPTGCLVLNNDSLVTSDINNISVYVNSPKTSLFDRQVAEHFGIDLNDRANSVNTTYEINNGLLKYNCKITQSKITTNEENGNNIVKVEPEEITYGEKETIKYGYELVNKIASGIGGSYYNKTFDYALEEIIEIGTDISKISKIYVYFNNKNTYNSSDNSIINYSKSHNFFLSNDNTNTNDILVFEITFNSDGIDVSNKLSSIDLNFLELKKILINNEMILDYNSKVKVKNDISISDLISFYFSNSIPIAKFKNIEFENCVNFCEKNALLGLI